MNKNEILEKLTPTCFPHFSVTFREIGPTAP